MKSIERRMQKLERKGRGVQLAVVPDETTPEERLAAVEAHRRANELPAAACPVIVITETETRL